MAEILLTWYYGSSFYKIFGSLSSLANFLLLHKHRAWRVAAKGARIIFSTNIENEEEGIFKFTLILSPTHKIKA